VDLCAELWKRQQLGVLVVHLPVLWTLVRAEVDWPTDHFCVVAEEHGAPEQPENHHDLPKNTAQMW